MGCCKVVGTYISDCEVCLGGKLTEDELEKIPKEELELQDWENRTHFNSFNSRAIVDELLSAGKEGRIKEEELKAIIRGLGGEGELEGFERFKGPGGYDVSKLLKAAILLGAGSNGDKLYSLFSVMDPEGTLVVTKAVLTSTIQELLDCALEFHEIESKYLNRLRAVRIPAGYLLASEVCQHDSFTQTQLQSILDQRGAWHIFSAKTLRAWMSSASFPPELIQKIKQTTEESTGFPIGNFYKNDSILSNNSRPSEILPENVEEEPLSSSSDSSGPVCLTVNISPGKQEVFSIYPHEDAVRKALLFSEEHQIPEPYKKKLLSTVSQLKSSIL